MANYNTFNLINTKTRKTIFTTSSARKCKKALEKGYRVDVWNNNNLVETIYSRNIESINKYVQLEKEYIANKQRKAEERNKRKRMRAVT